MATTILEQIRENVASGAVLPHLGDAPRSPKAAAAPSQAPVDEEISRAEAAVLAQIDAEIDGFLERVLALPQLHALPLDQATVRSRIERRFDDVVTEEIGHAPLAMSWAAEGDAGASRDATPAPRAAPDNSALLDQIRGLIEPLRGIPALLEGRDSPPQSDDIVRHLAELTGEVRKLAPAAVDPAEDPEIPMEGTGVPLEDIQKMIEFLK